MKGIKTLIIRFEKLHNGYKAYFDDMESYRGYYKVYIVDTETDIGTWYVFTSCSDFRNWMDKVILD